MLSVYDVHDTWRGIQYATLVKSITGSFCLWMWKLLTFNVVDFYLALVHKINVNVFIVRLFKTCDVMKRIAFAFGDIIIFFFLNVVNKIKMYHSLIPVLVIKLSSIFWPVLDCFCGVLATVPYRQLYNHMWHDQGKWVTCRQCSILSFQYNLLIHLKSYMLIQTPLQSEIWFQRNEQIFEFLNNVKH